jgi:Ca-activated chloride channel family protein
MIARRIFLQRLPGLVACCVLMTPALGYAAPLIDLFLTPEQQGQRLLEQGDPSAAATHFTDPMRAGVAWYRAGDFERAAASFGRIATAEGHFNRGNALLMLGKYPAAIEAFDAALALRSAWTSAEENRALALARQARLAPPDETGGGTGGMIGADEVVFNSDGRTAGGGGDEVTDEGGEGLNELQMRELWLRRVETRPADFLRARFARQLAIEASPQP